jgi:hypothetical protein
MNVSDQTERTRQLAPKARLPAWQILGAAAQERNHIVSFNNTHQLVAAVYHWQCPQIVFVEEFGHLILIRVHAAMDSLAFR